MATESKPQRPVYLNLFQIVQPLGAVVSILHRVTGILLVLLLPLALYGVQQSLRGPEEFIQVAGWFETGLGRVTTIVATGVFAQHFFSGVRLLLLDIDIGIERSRARLAAWLTFVGTSLAILAVATALL